MKSKYSILVFFILALLLGYFAYSSLIKKEVSPGNINTLDITPVTDDKKVDVEIPSDWVSYSSDNLNLEIYYPREMDLNENEDGTLRLIFIGPSQAIGTEVYDGLILTFSKGSYTDSDLASYVESIVKEKKNDPIYIQLTDSETTMLGNKQGYKFTESALGTFTNIYLPTGEKSYLAITYLLEDPTNQGFEVTLDLILNSLVLK